MSCDPLFEDCSALAETTEVSLAETTEVAPVEEEEQKASGSLVELIYGLSFGVACAYGAFSGFRLDWLTGEIEKDTRYPADVADSHDIDRTWATNAKEPAAWARAGFFMLATYSFSTILWALNLALGGNAGTVHRLFYRFSQVFPMVPFLNLIYIYRIKNSYLLNNMFTFYDNLGSVKPDEYIWMYDPTQTDPTSPHYFNVADHNKKLWNAAWNQILIAVLAFYAQPVIDKQWITAVIEKRMADANGDNEEEEPAAEEPAAEEEPAFF
jgi:hypothetical protein